MGIFRFPGLRGELLEFETPRPRRFSLSVNSLADLGYFALMTYGPDDPSKKATTISATLVRLPGGMQVRLGDLTLSSSPKDGVPIDNTTEEQNRAELRLEQPVFEMSTDGTGKGRATISIEDKYPKRLSDPLKLPVYFTTDGSTVDGDITLGPVRMDFQLRVKYDTQKLARAALQALRLGTFNAVRGELLQQLTHPNIVGRAAVELAVVKKIPVLKHILQSKIDFQIDTRKIPGHPLMGAPLDMPFTYRARGLIPIPAGGLLNVGSVGWGYSRASFGARGGHSFTAATLALPDTEAISAMDVGSMFTGYAYVEYFKVARITDGFDLGVRVTVAKSTEGAGSGASDPVQLQYLHAQAKPWLPSSRTNVPLEMNKPLVMFRIEGRFDGL